MVARTSNAKVGMSIRIQASDIVTLIRLTIRDLHCR